MTVAKNPGIGQGKGGGRPKRGQKARREFSLTPEAALLLDAQIEVMRIPAWKVIDNLVKAAFAGKPLPEAPPPMPKEAQEIAQDASNFLARHPDNPQAAKTLKRAWGQAISMANHSIRNAE